MDAEDYRRQLAALLPSGPAWSRAVSTVLQTLLAAWGVELGRVEQRALALLPEAHPDTVSELLADWELVFGLPDTCLPEVVGADLRRAMLTARVTAVGGQSPAYFTALAAAMGVPITITEYRPYTTTTPVGSPLLGTAWAYAWLVTVTTGAQAITRRTVSDGPAVPLGSWVTATALECVFRRLKPAHTHVLFAYV